MFKIKNAALLQLFAEGGDGSGAPPAAEGTTGEAPAAAGQEETAEEAFARFIERYGEDAKPLADHHKKNFGKRYAALKESEAKAQRLDDFRKTVARRYPNADAEDIDALEKAFLSDTRFFGEQALETGRAAEDLAADELRNVELERLRAAEKQRKTQAAQEKKARDFQNRLAAEEAELKKAYPDLDMEKELKNPKMRDKLLRGEPLEDAYHAVHHKELMQRAVADTKNATVNSIASKGMRATEGASSASVPRTATKDFSKMPREEFMKIFRSR